MTWSMNGPRTKGQKIKNLRQALEVFTIVPDGGVVAFQSTKAYTVLALSFSFRFVLYFVFIPLHVSSHVVCVASAQLAGLASSFPTI